MSWTSFIFASILIFLLRKKKKCIFKFHFTTAQTFEFENLQALRQSFKAIDVHWAWFLQIHYDIFEKKFRHRTTRKKNKFDFLNEMILYFEKLTKITLLSTICWNYQSTTQLKIFWILKRWSCQSNFIFERNCYDYLFDQCFMRFKKFSNQFVVFENTFCTRNDESWRNTLFFVYSKKNLWHENVQCSKKNSRSS